MRPQSKWGTSEAMQSSSTYCRHSDIVRPWCLSTVMCGKLMVPRSTDQSLAWLTLITHSDRPDNPKSAPAAIRLFILSTQLAWFHLFTETTAKAATLFLWIIASMGVENRGRADHSITESESLFQLMFSLLWSVPLESSSVGNCCLFYCYHLLIELVSFLQ